MRSGGVKAPEPILLPDPAVRFARTAERLELLSKGHPMEGWLAFMAKLARAQLRAASSLALLSAPDEATVEQAVAARIPPISADGHRRDPAWRDGLALLLDTVSERLPSPAAAVASELRARSAASTEALADAFLRGVIDEKDAGSTFWIAAALQVYFTCLAGRLPARALRLLEQRSLCPCCGSTSSASLVTGSGQNPGARYLSCSLCSTAWNYSRAVCVTCGGSRTLAIRGIRRGFRRCEGRDLRRMRDLLEDGVSGQGHAGRPLRRRPRHARARCHGRGNRLGAPRPQSAAAGRLAGDGQGGLERKPTACPPKLWLNTTQALSSSPVPMAANRVAASSMKALTKGETCRLLG